MKLIQKLNVIFLGVIILSVFFVGGIFYCTSQDNQKFSRIKDGINDENVFAYKQNFSGKINLKIIDNAEAAEKELNKEESITKISNVEDSISKKESLVFIGGALDVEVKNEDDVIESRLADIAKLDFGPVIFAGGLIDFEDGKTEIISERILRIKDLLSSNFENEFSITFGNPDIACGEKCIESWNEIFFGKKTEIKKGELLFFHSFEYESAKILLLGPKFFGDDWENNLSWLDNELLNNKKENTIVVSYTSINDFESKKKCKGECFVEVKNKVKDLFIKYNVDLVVSGDQGNFSNQKEGGVSYFSVGDFGNMSVNEKGVSFLKIDFDEKEMTLFGYNNKQEKISEFKIK